MIEASLLSLFLLGLLGGVHCAGMCGGIVSTLSQRATRRFPVTVAVQGPSAAVPATDWSVLAAYNLGRLSSYALAGAIAGGAGSLAFVLQRLLPVQQAAFVLADLMLVAVGLHLLGVTRVLGTLERAGAASVGRLWTRLRPAAARSLRAQGVPGAFGAGLLWGCVPCGMVYTGLVAALASGGAGQGALLMLAFGLGTLPNLLGLGWLAGQAGVRLRGDGRPARALRAAAGVAILVFGLAGLARLDPTGHLQGFAELCLTPFTAGAR